MTTVQLNTDILRSLCVIAEKDESMLKRATKYLHRMAKQLTEDPTLMSKEEFFARIDEAEKGPTYSMLPDETVEQMLVRLGYV